jgi:hypothetical protein
MFACDADLGIQPTSFLTPCSDMNQCFNFELQAFNGSCNVSCGSGKLSVTYTCLKKRQNGDLVATVPLSECGMELDVDSVSYSVIEDCQFHCEYEFKEWSECTVTCGSSGTRTRDRSCIQLPLRKEVDFEECSEDPNLSLLPRDETESCNLGSCPCELMFYSAGRWSRCSSTCEGVRTRAITCNCVIEGRTRIQSLRVCDEQNIPLRPATTSSCGGQCPTVVYSYKYGPWRDCGSDCGQGMNFRLVQCVRTQGRRIRRIVPIQECVDNGQGQPGPSYRSYHSKCRYATTPFEECSVSCGRGIQTRHVICLRIGELNNEMVTTAVDLAKCQDDPTIPDPTLPRATQVCNIQDCRA